LSLTSYKVLIAGFLSLGILSSCATQPNPPVNNQSSHNASGYMSSLPDSGIYLKDRVSFSQKDPRWARQTMGGSNETLEREGCLVTATAMALVNLGYETDPHHLNASLKSVGGYTDTGGLIWAGVERVTRGQIRARYYTDVSDEIMDGCLADNYYPLVQYKLPSGLDHWVMVAGRAAQRIYIRDPLRPSQTPIIFTGNTDRFTAIRCVGPSSSN